MDINHKYNVNNRIKKTQFSLQIKCLNSRTFLSLFLYMGIQYMYIVIPLNDI